MSDVGIELADLVFMILISLPNFCFSFLCLSVMLLMGCSYSVVVTVIVDGKAFFPSSIWLLRIATTLLFYKGTSGDFKSSSGFFCVIS